MEDVSTIERLLPEAMLRRFRERAPEYDTENRFFADDLAELAESGYLAAVAPTTMGGSGLSLDELTIAQRRLASYAPATALGVNMHLVWVQVARFLHDRAASQGDTAALDWVLRDAVAGEIFAFGISEAGNDAVLLDALTTATPAASLTATPHDAGDYLLNGIKVFTTLSPVWTRLGVHAKDASTGDDGTLVFGFLRRESAGVRATTEGSRGLGEGAITHPGVWNPLGMRATQSWLTRLEDVRLRGTDVAAKIVPFDASDPLVLAIFSSFSLLTASVYAGIADRALELAAETAKTPTNDDGSSTRLDDSDTAARLTAAVLDHRQAVNTLTFLARDVDQHSDRDDWFLALAACKNQVTDEAKRAVDVAMRLVGSRGFHADSELARLYRDVLAGTLHPSSSRALADTVRRSIRDS